MYYITLPNKVIFSLNIVQLIYNEPFPYGIQILCSFAVLPFNYLRLSIVYADTYKPPVKSLSLIKLMNDPKSDQRKKDFQLTDEKNDQSTGDLLPNIKQFNIDKSKYQHYGHKSSMTAQALNKIIDEPQKKSTSSINNSISKLLGIPVGEDEDTSWPYKSETLSDLIKLKTEQERTKQEQIRTEFAATSLKLLTLIKSMNVDPELIPQFFRNSSTDLKKSIDVLSSGSYSDNRKRSYSETVSDEVLVSPIRSPSRSPDSVNKREISQESMHRRERSDENLMASNVQSPSSNNLSQQQSPNQIPQAPLPPQMYPVYYHGPIPPPPPPPGSQSSGDGSNGLGSPYQQKYHLMYPPPNQMVPGPVPGPAGPGPGPNPYYPPQYHYYVTSPPQPKPQSQQQHSHPPYTSMVPPMAPPAAFASHEDESPSHKKQKSINFMISTPKNPPARKYNNPKEK